MMRHTLRFSVAVAVLILFATFTVLTMGTLSAEEVNAQGNCTLKTIKGTYLFEAQGNFRIDEETTLPYVEAGTWTLDGNGNAAGVFSAILGTEIIEKEAFNATYTHDSGCVFTALAPVGENEFVQFDLYTTPSGQFMTYFGPGFSGTQRKQ